MSDYRHEHHRHDRDHLELSETELRALESILTEKKARSIRPRPTF